MTTNPPALSQSLDEVIRDRVVDFRKMLASELLDNDGNWRVHPKVQQEFLDGVLKQIGRAGALTAYYSERNGGKLTLIDGHLRKSRNPNLTWSVLITDLNDAEADLLMLVLDPMSAMAQADKEKANALLARANADEMAVREHLERMQRDINAVVADVEQAEAEQKADEAGPAAMELLPFEHYDYVLLFFKHELDWLAAIETLNLERRADLRKTKKVGLARAIDGPRVISRMRNQEAIITNLMQQLKVAGIKPNLETPYERTQTVSDMAGHPVEVTTVSPASAEPVAPAHAVAPLSPPPLPAHPFPAVSPAAPQESDPQAEPGDEPASPPPATRRAADGSVLTSVFRGRGKAKQAAPAPSTESDDD